MSNNFGFKIYYGLVFLTCLGLLAMKLITSYWIPEWSQAFYIVSAALGVLAIGKIVLKTIRLHMAEHRFGKQLIVLPALHFEEKRLHPFTFKRFLGAVGVYTIVFSSLAGGGFFVYEHVLAPLQSIPSGACASQPTAMPAILNNVPSLDKWQQNGNLNATFTYTKAGNTGDQLCPVSLNALLMGFVWFEVTNQCSLCQCPVSWQKNTALYPLLRG